MKRLTTTHRSVDGVSRRTVLRAGAATAGALAVSASAVATDEDEDVPDSIDAPDGFEVEVFAEHAPFGDDVAATVDLPFVDEDDGDRIRVELDDSSTVVLAQATWEEGGRSGWHRHPGLSIGSVLEGEIEVTMGHDCVPRPYAAGDAWIDPGHVHKADSEDGALAYVTYLGVPDGEPVTEWVEPVDCNLDRTVPVGPGPI